MKLELVSFNTTDRLELPGLLHAPDTPVHKVFIWLHGMGDSGIFYSQARIHALAEALTSCGIAFFPFNNRGAHNIKTLRKVGDNPEDEDGEYQAGTYYEKITDCAADIDGAVSFLRSRGYGEFYLGGHSTGANKICVYDARTPGNPFSKYVLAGPGDDSGLFYDELGEAAFFGALEEAKRLIRAGTPEAVMPESSGMHPFSAQAAADILDPDGDYNTFPLFECTTKRLGSKPLFKEYSAITKPMLVVYGANDEFTYTGGGTESALDLFRKHTGKEAMRQSAFISLADTDHGFHGREQAFAQTAADWLAA